MDRPEDLTETLAAVGRALLAWGWLETEMTVVLDRQGAPPHASPIARWRQAHHLLPSSLFDRTAEIERLAGVRNLIAHGLSAARSLPTPEVEVRAQGGASAVISLDELVAVAQALDRVRCEIARTR